MAQLFRNNAFSTLAGSITNVATTLTVAAGHGDRFPIVTSPDFALVTLQNSANNIEIVRVTARLAGADSMTIQRAQDGTAARAWTAADIVELRLTSFALNPLGVLAGASTEALIRAALDVPTRGGLNALGSWAISITGNAATATRLATARSINGVSFNGESDITVADSTKVPLSGGNMTGPLNVTHLSVAAAGGDEGGEIALARPLTTNLAADAILDINQNSFRIFEDGGVRRGAFINITQCGGNASSELLHSGNYNNFAPTRTGGGASGTWGINITGNASSATTATTVTNGVYTTGSQFITGEKTFGSRLVASRINQGDWSDRTMLLDSPSNEPGIGFHAGGSQTAAIFKFHGPTETFEVRNGNDNGFADLHAKRLLATEFAGVGALGTYAFARSPTGAVYNPGDVVAGSSIQYTNGSGGQRVGSTQVGSWRCMGATEGGGGFASTLFIRIS